MPRAASPGTAGVPLTKPDTGAVVESDFSSDEPPAEVHLTDARFQPEVVFVAVVCALVTVVFGIFPEPLFDVARDAGEAIQSLV